jgi:hypothetical protein
MAERPSQKLTNQQKLDFLIDSILTGGESMDGGNSLQFQIKHAPIDALKELTMDWGKYKTSVIDQLVFTAQAIDRIEARQVAQTAILEQIAKAATGVALSIDYDEIERRIAANMPVYVPQVKEGDN